MEYSLYDAFEQFVNQIQFGINSFLAIFTIIITIIVAIGAYFVYTVATKSAKAGVEKAAKDLKEQNNLLKRIETVENGMTDVKNYISNFGMRLYLAPMSENHTSNIERIYYGKTGSYIYVSGTFIPHGKQEIVSHLPFGFSPTSSTYVVAISCSSDAQYGTIQITPEGAIISNISESDSLFVFQTFLAPFE